MTGRATGRAAGAHHFFVSPSDVRDGVVELTGAEAHHAARVLRVRVGEAITVADGSGLVLEAVVTEVGDVVRADVQTSREKVAPKPSVTLYQAVAKGERMDDVVSRAVEIGVRRVVPFVAERTIVRWDEGKRRKARERWTTIARSAAKQCRSPHLTDLEELRDGPEDALNEGAPVVALHERAATRLRDALPQTAPEEIVVVVGPEGGLAPSEVRVLEDGGASVVTLGDRILRTETAGLVAAAIIGYAYGSLG